MTPAAALPSVGMGMDIRCGHAMASAIVTAIDDTHITLELSTGSTAVLPLSSLQRVDWYPNAGQA